MATTTLRAYLDELNGLLEQEALEEVIGHCRHILQHFPKNIATYRILGQALLEKARAAEAADVFGRVLAAVPDDYIAHICLSDAHKDSNLTAAIWHLERAYELEPDNEALQSELKRLYGIRDGEEPSDLQLTRGALARLYVKGRLYSEAIAELQSALAGAPDRIDLRLLLAHTLWENDHPVEAGETALSVLNVLPDSVEANRILAALWLLSSRPTDAEPFVARLEQLDPFLAWDLVHGDAEPVPTNAFRLDRLNWDARAAAQMATDVPDWVASIGEVFDAPETFSMPSAPVPETLAPSGRSGILKRGKTGQLADQPGTGNLGGASAPPPAGPSALIATQTSPLPQMDPDEVPEWFRDIAGTMPTATGTPSTGGLAADTGGGDFGGDVPDWLADVSPSMPAPANEDVPDWLSEAIGDIQPAAQPDAPIDPMAWLNTGSLDASNLPDEQDSPELAWLDDSIGSMPPAGEPWAASPSFNAPVEAPEPEPAADPMAWLLTGPLDASTLPDHQPEPANIASPQNDALGWLGDDAAASGSDSAADPMAWLLTGPLESDSLPPEPKPVPSAGVVPADEALSWLDDAGSVSAAPDDVNSLDSFSWMQDLPDDRPADPARGVTTELPWMQTSEPEMTALDGNTADPMAWLNTGPLDANVLDAQAQTTGDSLPWLSTGPLDSNVLDDKAPESVTEADSLAWLSTGPLPDQPAASFEPESLLPTADNAAQMDSEADSLAWLSTGPLPDQPADSFEPESLLPAADSTAEKDDFDWFNELSEVPADELDLSGLPDLEPSAQAEIETQEPGALPWLDTDQLNAEGLTFAQAEQTELQPDIPTTDPEGVAQSDPMAWFYELSTPQESEAAAPGAESLAWLQDDTADQPTGETPAWLMTGPLPSLDDEPAAKRRASESSSWLNEAFSSALDKKQEQAPLSEPPAEPAEITPEWLDSDPEIPVRNPEALVPEGDRLEDDWFAASDAEDALQAEAASVDDDPVAWMRQFGMSPVDVPATSAPDLALMAEFEDLRQSLEEPADDSSGDDMLAWLEQPDAPGVSTPRTPAAPLEPSGTNQLASDLVPPAPSLKEPVLEDDWLAGFESDAAPAGSRMANAFAWEAEVEPLATIRDLGDAPAAPVASIVDSDEVLPAENVPSWMQAAAPLPAEPMPTDAETPAWMRDAEGPVATDASPDWLNQPDNQFTELVRAAKEKSAQPASSGTETGILGDGPMPDWLSLLGDEPEAPAAASEPLAASQSASGSSPARPDSDFAFATDAEADAPGGSTDWLSGLGAPETAMTAEPQALIDDLFGGDADDQQEQTDASGAMPDWLQSMAPAATATASTPTVSPEALDFDSLFAPEPTDSEPREPMVTDDQERIAPAAKLVNTTETPEKRERITFDKPPAWKRKKQDKPQG